MLRANHWVPADLLYLGCYLAERIPKYRVEDMLLPWTLHVSFAPTALFRATEETFTSALGKLFTALT